LLEGQKALLLACTIALSAPSAGCDDLQVEQFVASRWDESRECLEASGTIDVYEDDTPADCGATPRCWVAPDDDIYATTACEAPPGWAQTSAGEDDRCDDALAAWERGEDGRCDE